jgi:hypothetical protein
MAAKTYSDEFRRQAVDLYESTAGATFKGIAAGSPGSGCGAGSAPRSPSRPIARSQLTAFGDQTAEIMVFSPLRETAAANAASAWSSGYVAVISDSASTRRFASRRSTRG